NASQMCVALLGLDVLRRAQEEDGDGALASCRAIVNVGRTVGDPSELHALMIRTDAINPALDRIERTLAQAQPSDAALVPLQRLLEDEDRQPVLLCALRGERAIMSRLFETFRRGEGAAWPLWLLLPRGNQWEHFLWETLLSLLADPIPLQQATHLRRQTQLVEIAKLPADQQDARLNLLRPLPRLRYVTTLSY